jgi:hypothetical protein
MQRTGRLGCFALTERLAGVNSGLVVHTTACWVCDDKDKAGGYFLLNTPHPGAKKNWISQGLTASLGVVVADLIVNGETVGPQYVLGLSRIPILFARARLTLSFIYPSATPLRTHPRRPAVSLVLRPGVFHGV